MKKLTFEKKINAPAQKVWDILWSNETYSEWTKHFSPGSKISADWREGGTAKFVDSEGKTGMIHTISRLNEPHEVVFTARGVIENGKEDFDSEEVKKMQGASESYELKGDNGITTLISSVDVMPEYEDHMKTGFEKGFEEVKRMAEK